MKKQISKYVEAGMSDRLRPSCHLASAHPPGSGTLRQTNNSLEIISLSDLDTDSEANWPRVAGRAAWEQTAWTPAQQTHTTPRTYITTHTLYVHALERQGDTRLPSVNLGPHNISKTTRARKFKLKMPLDILKYSLGYYSFSARGHPGGTGPPTNLGLP